MHPASTPGCSPAAARRDRRGAAGDWTALAAAALALALAASAGRAETVVCGNIASPTTWTLAGSPYRVTCDVRIVNNTTLTIEPGVVVQFESGTNLDVGVNGDGSSVGTLLALGTEAAPITFTSTAGAPGSWGALSFMEYSGTLTLPSQIRWCVVEHGGQTRYGVNANVRVQAFNGIPYVEFDHCTIRDGSGYGLFADLASFAVMNTSFEGNGSTDVFCYNNADPVFMNCDFQTGSHLGVDITATNCIPTFANCSFTGTGAHALRVTGMSLDHGGHTLSGYSTGIYVVGSSLTVNRRWNALPPGMAYEMETTSVNAQATLTLDPGVVLRFRSGASLVIGGNGDGNAHGTLLAVGNETAPITFTSTSGAPGGWAALAFPEYSGSPGAPSQLSWCVIEQGGQTYSGVSTNVYVRAFNSTPYVEFDHCTIRAGSGYGLFADLATFAVTNTSFEGNGSTDAFCYNNADPVFTNCDFQTGSHLGVDITATNCIPLFSNCSFTGTGAHALRVTGASLDHGGHMLSGYSTGIYVVGSSLTVNRRWNALPPGMAYEMESMTVNAFATLTLDPGVVLRFQPGASLVIGGNGDGNALGTLLAVGSESAPITFTSTSGTPGSWAALAFPEYSGLSGAPSQLSWCVIEHGGQTYAGANANIYVRAFNSTPHVEFDHCIIRFSAGAGIRSYSCAFPIHHSSIVDNVGGGIVSDGGTIVDATNNWWGDASGPNDPSAGGVDSNPTGTGQYVTDYVSYRPWLTVPAHSFDITASAGDGGTIAPAGVVPVGIGTNQEFVITPDACSVIQDVWVDGASVGAVPSYTFTSVHAPHTISASFQEVAYAITASAGPNGAIAPSGVLPVACGSGAMFTMQPVLGYEVADVRVDGASVGAVSAYVFGNIAANHTIEASFQEQKPHITSVLDVPNDNGRRVKLSWRGSVLSHHYWIFRSVGVTAGRPSLAASDGWEFLDEAPARPFLNEYSLLAATASDSGDVNPNTAFLVVGMSADNAQRWPSLPASGYSVDNIPPPPPIPFTAEYIPGSPNRPAGARSQAKEAGEGFDGGFTWLHWGPNPAEDFQTFRLYRDVVADFVPGPANFLAAQPDTGYQDPGPAGRYYKLLAVDKHGNASTAAEVGPEETNGLEPAGDANTVWMVEPFPNPASTADVILRFGMPADGEARLTLYSAGGRRVRELLGRSLARGEYRWRWDLRDDRGQRVSPGVYFARLRAGTNGVVDRRIVLVR